MDTTYTELIEQSRIGDQTAFGQIVRKYQGIVSGVVYGILGDFHKSEDIAQETFLIAWTKLDELRDSEKLPGWLCGIARNLACQSRLKAPKIQTVSISQTEEIAETTVDPARILAQSEQNRLIWNALEKIPEKYRIPLVCYYRNEKSVPEIAEALEISENSLHARLNRARKFLRKELEKQVEGAILSSGPGEFFSLTVVAALPAITAFSTTGKAAAAVVSAETTVAASAMVAAPKVGSPHVTLFGASSWWFGIQPAISVLLVLFSWFFWILGVVPGIWVSVKNAPTLRARRYLILCSLRLYGLFGLLVLFLLVFLVLQLMIREIGLAPMLFGGYNTQFESSLYSLVFTAGLGGICAAALYIFIVSPITYRRIIREDTGLIVSQKAVPLEESFLSLRRLNRTFFRIGIFLLAVFTFGVICAMPDFQNDWSKLKTVVCTDTICTTCGDVTYTTILLRLYSQWTIAGAFFLLVFRQMHRSFLVTAKDETSFAPGSFENSIANRSFGNRVFYEWIVSFGFFCAAGMVLLFQMLWYTFAPT
jgi:RNA polymerase sigma factor (sigma-70 family)